MIIEQQKPFHLEPDKNRAHVLILFRRFLSYENAHSYYAFGLGVSAMHAVRVLRRCKVNAHAVGILSVKGIREQLKKYSRTTHCIIETPWVPIADMEKLLDDFPDVHFIPRAHSQISFLQIEPQVISIMRDLIMLQDIKTNISISSNSKHLVNFFECTYGGDVLYLPNLYDVHHAHPRDHKPPHGHRVLRIGSFGALRWLKNHTTAAAAALMIARHRDTDLEFYIVDDHAKNGQSIKRAIHSMIDGLQWAKLIEVPWAKWAVFRRTIRHMDLCMQLSHTETFNVVTADAVMEGVPSVVTSVIEWAPKRWQVGPDDVEDAATVGSNLLSSHTAAKEGLIALRQFNDHAIRVWLAFLDSQPTNRDSRLT